MGAADVLNVVAADHLPPSSTRALFLLLADVGTSGLFAVAVAVPLVLIVGALLRGRAPSEEQATWGAFLGGIAAVGLADLGEFWFSDPPPFTETFATHGNPLVFGLLALLIGGLWFALSRVPGRKAQALSVS